MSTAHNPGGWKHDLSESAQDFVDIVWPAIKPWCGQNSRVVPMESVSSKGLVRDFDVLAGIDAWNIADGDGIRGIGSRIQWAPNPNEPWGPWATFTIRKQRWTGTETEWDKRRAAIDGKRGFIYPHLTCHAYIDRRPKHRNGAPGKLLAVYMARTAEIFQFATDEFKNVVWRSRRNGSDDNEFAAFCVDRLKERGVHVREFESVNPTSLFTAALRHQEPRIPF